MQLAYRIAAQNSVCNGLTVKSSLGSEHPNPNFNQKRGETETQALNRNRIGAEFVIVRLNSEVLRKYTLEICEIGKYFVLEIIRYIFVTYACAVAMLSLFCRSLRRAR